MNTMMSILKFRHRMLHDVMKERILFILFCKKDKRIKFIFTNFVIQSHKKNKKEKVREKILKILRKIIIKIHSPKVN